jgi:hypothetical protein
MSAAAAPAIRRPRESNLADILRRQMAAIRDHHFVPFGQMMRVQLGISDGSSYFQEQVRRRLSPITLIQGLILDWTQDCAPQIAEMNDGRTGRTMQFLFPRGVPAPPRIYDPRYCKLHIADPDPPKIPQDVADYSSGIIVQRDGTRFYVLQPIERIAVRPYGVATIIVLHGRTSPWDGTKVAMLYQPPRGDSVGVGFLVRGLVSFD